jgi:RHS repeat-associated protein
MTYPEGRTVTYELNSIGKVSRVTTVKNGNNRTLAENIGYRSFGPLNALSYGNGTALNKGLDQLFQTTDIDAGAVQSLDYTIGPAGNVTGITNNLDSNRNQTFTYDDLYRLTGATGIYGSISHTYDNADNRLTKTIGGQTDTYSYVAGTNKLGEITGANPMTFGYDANGNTTGMGARTLNYNLNNRLIQVVEGTVLADYVYNGLGQRIKKTVNETTTIYHYDRFGNLIGESDALGNFTNKYVYLGDSRLSHIGASEDIYYFVNDHLGTPQRIMDGSSNVVWSADYQPFGDANITVSTLPNNFRFPGQYYDSETGLHYNYFRYYSPGIGRYLRPDPIGLLGGINLYAYVQNNPINLVDPMGLDGSMFEKAINLCEFYAKYLEKPISPYAIAGGLVVSGGAAMVAGLVTVKAGVATGPIGWVILVPTGFVVSFAGATAFLVGVDVYIDQLRHKTGINLDLLPWVDLFPASNQRSINECSKKKDEVCSK